MLTIHKSQGGNVPHVALWSEKGERIGQSNPGKSKTKAGGDSIIVIEHSQAADENETPGYIMLSNYKVDAICIAALYITETHTSTAWYGDYGYKCGMSWGLSKEEIGAERAVPKCVWLDGDGTNGINSQAMSMHIKDMVANSDRLAQYQENPDTMCKSTPRFSFWGDLLPDSRIPIFDPELEYETDSCTFSDLIIIL
ncbi:hypothetical protein RRF57_006206 [Xylaria bambusicola]|uniref:Uncharacterized protein n=1 Tax=Xylaria bambusicola TaxID=326684 RepID=A0AAN7URQ5_9PEZI